MLEQNKQKNIVFAEVILLNDYYPKGICPTNDFQLGWLPSMQNEYKTQKIRLVAKDDRWQISITVDFFSEPVYPTKEEEVIVIAKKKQLLQYLLKQELKFVLLGNNLCTYDINNLQGDLMKLGANNPIAKNNIISPHNLLEVKTCDVLQDDKDIVFFKNNATALKILPHINIDQNLIDQATKGKPIVFSLYFPRQMGRRIYVWRNKEYATLKRYPLKQHENEPIEEEQRIVEMLLANKWNPPSSGSNAENRIPQLPTPQPQNRIIDPIFTTEFAYKINL